jgi:molecular chaperone DnaK
MGTAIGIDLGTTMSAMAIVDPNLGRPVMIHNHEGQTLTPSAVLVRGEERVVGDSAKRAAIARPDNVFQFIKRAMCEPDFVFTDADEKTHRPEELSALILKKLKQDAEHALGTEVTDAVITVPAYFADLERNRTKQAGAVAGFNVLDIINEPTAAALAYGIGKGEPDKTILVYDLGGGTFDVTIMKMIGRDELQVLTSGGHKSLGGADFDKDLSNHFVQKFEAAHSVDFKKSGNLRIDREFREKAEKAKIDLSSNTEVDVSLSALGKVLDLTLKRAEFEDIIRSHIDLTRDLTKDALKVAGLDWRDIDKVLLVGGSTRIPMVRGMVQELTGKRPEMGFNPDEVVALGAAIYTANLRGEKVRDDRGRTLEPVRVRNVTAHSLGIIVRDEAGEKEMNSIIIKKDTELPAENTERDYRTIEDNQTNVRLQVIQGEDEDPEHCTKVGEAVLREIPAQPKGVARIDVTLGYDASGIITLYAKEQRSGRDVRSEIECPGLMSEAQIERATERVGGLKVS